MGKKLQWHKQYSDRYLADREVNRLTLSEQGFLHIANCILRTQTDAPGRYIIRGRFGTRQELIRDVKRYVRTPPGQREQALSNYLATILATTLLEESNDGLIYSPYICQEVAESTINAIHGKLGGNPALNPPLKAEKNKNKIRKEEESTTSSVKCGGNSPKPAADGEQPKARRSGFRKLGDFLRGNRTVRARAVDDDPT